MVMISKSIAVIAALTPLSAAAHAESAPKELYGKSIIVTWTESVTGKLGGEEVTRNFVKSYQMSIYLSTAGRPFMRLIQGGAGVGNHHLQGIGGVAGQLENSPDASQHEIHVDFAGRSIVVYREFESGAHRIAIEFDGTNTNCKATVVNGRQAGKKGLVQVSSRGGRTEVSSIEVGTTNCSIREGNVFGQ
jgi:hypothetical protein